MKQLSGRLTVPKSPIGSTNDWWGMKENPHQSKFHFIMTFALMLIVLGWYYEVGLVNVLITTIALTVLGYIGDIFLLPRIGNALATLGDFILGILVVYGVGTLLYDEIPVGTAAFVISIILIVGEMFFHQYIEERVFEPQTTDSRDKKGYYQRVGLYKEYAEYKQKMSK